MRPPVNVLRLSLHPQGLAPRIRNLAAWRAHLLERLQQQVAASGDATLAALAGELKGYPAPADDVPAAEQHVVVPLVLDAPGGPLSFFSTTTVFGTPMDITLSELAMECFYPANEATAAALMQNRSLNAKADAEPLKV